jgi:hypothetical protein
VTELNEEDLALAQWSRRLSHALQILDLELDHALIRRLAKESSEAVNDGAGPISAVVVGYAAGLSAAKGKASPSEAIESAAEVALKLCEHGADGGPDSEGWSGTAQ